ncbi:uncharacterized protein EKO05_0005201 [Ascochyta rabiei]|uniref:uncharacterized protein n=1 Tax=Didymella rabiei TaxID=5454 RepID=UPI00220113E0|nr:uncharacterized protein EKO05_0005201 [Ascochyta rabiei]UPX14727.1 hypothetical protein EKO05_0005201 [Ascochyta rabiei]
MQVPCSACGALHWIDERKSTTSVTDPRFTLCCLDGEVNLPALTPLPSYLYQLLNTNTLAARHFRKELQAYNAAFAFTSVDCTPTSRGAQGPGVQVFQIHGALYHRSGPVEVLKGSLPQYAQLYFYNPQFSKI